jgi:hypothetical protein
VAFTAPANVGGSAISSYRVLANPGGVGATTASSPVTFSGLTDGTTYTFSVAAVNSYGFSPYSAAATATTVTPIEDIFSTWLYTGNGSTQTITNGINLSGQGGLVWVKSRTNAGFHAITDTARGVGQNLYTNSTSAQFFDSTSLTAFSSSGFSLGADAFMNGNGQNYASWTFREAPNFFDVVTYTGDGSSTRTINHNLGIAAGMVLVKRTDSTGGWKVWHRSISDSGLLNSANLFGTGTSTGEPREGGYVSAASSTTFTLSNGAGAVQQVNASGGTYVAYVFAHYTASDGFIQCGTFTPVGSPLDVTLGWEPQWVLVKDTGTPTSQWQIFDNMRGFPAPGGGSANILVPNTSSAETTNSGCKPTSTGFNFTGSDFRQYIYVAIRRGPMRTPTLGTSVFSPVARTGTGSNTTVTAGFAVDFGISAQRPMASSSRIGPYSKLQGAGQVLNTNTSGAEDTRSDSVTGYTNTGIAVGADVGGGYVNASGQPIINWFFQRAPGFMDVVCYTGTGVARTVNHSLGVVPEMMIVKGRSTSIYSWVVYAAPLGSTKVLLLNTTNAGITENAYFNSTAPTSSVFTVNTAGATNENSSTYVSYLFASVPGVSKVGSYTGTGALQTINCAFTSGARFVLIKRTDSTGDWYVWDSARGIVAGNDPYLLLNSTAAEVTGTNYVDTDTTGFKVTAAAPAGINASGGNYIFLAIA